MAKLKFKDLAVEQQEQIRAALLTKKVTKAVAEITGENVEELVLKDSGRLIIKLKKEEAEAAE